MTDAEPRWDQPVYDCGWPTSLSGQAAAINGSYQRARPVCTVIAEEQANGRRARPALANVDQIASGDVLTMTRFDRINRAVSYFHAIGARMGA